MGVVMFRGGADGMVSYVETITAGMFGSASMERCAGATARGRDDA
jgi:hypothetical protein